VSSWWQQEAAGVISAGRGVGGGVKLSQRKGEREGLLLCFSLLKCIVNDKKLSLYSPSQVCFTNEGNW